MPGEKLATGEEGYFNLFTQEWRALPSDQHLGGLDIVGYNMYSFYSEGLAHVWGNGTHVQMGSTPTPSTRSWALLMKTATGRCALTTCPPLTI